MTDEKYTNRSGKIETLVRREAKPAHSSGGGGGG